MHLIKSVLCPCIYVLAGIVFFSCIVRAQGKIDTTTVKANEGFSVTGRFNTWGLIDMMDNNISPGVEISPNGKFSYGTDLAYIFYSTYFRERENSSVSGYILRPFARLYLNTSNQRTSASAWYLGVQLHYKHVMYKGDEWVGQGVVNGVAAYEEFKTTGWKKEVLGTHFLAGKKIKFGESGLGIDCYIGLGGRWKKEGYKDDDSNELFPNVIRRTSMFATTGNTNGLYVFNGAVLGGITLTYRFK